MDSYIKGAHKVDNKEPSQYRKPWCTYSIGIGACYQVYSCMNHVISPELLFLFPQKAIIELLDMPQRAHNDNFSILLIILHPPFCPILTSRD